MVRLVGAVRRIERKIGLLVGVDVAFVADLRRSGSIGSDFFSGSFRRPCTRCGALGAQLARTMVRLVGAVRRIEREIGLLARINVALVADLLTGIGSARARRCGRRLLAAGLLAGINGGTCARRVR